MTLVSGWSPSGRGVLAGFAGALFVFSITHFLLLPGTLPDVMSKNGDQKILDLQPVFSSDSVYQRLSSFGQAGREAYLQMMLTMDILFPVVFTTFLILLALYTVGRAGPGRTTQLLLLLLPLGYFIPDLAENFSIAWIIRNYPDRYDGLAGSLGYITTVKRLFMYAALALPLVLLFLNLLSRRSRST